MKWNNINDIFDIFDTYDIYDIYVIYDVCDILSVEVDQSFLITCLIFIKATTFIITQWYYIFGLFIIVLLFNYFIMYKISNPA